MQGRNTNERMHDAISKMVMEDTPHFQIYLVIVKVQFKTMLFKWSFSFVLKTKQAPQVEKSSSLSNQKGNFLRRSKPQNDLLLKCPAIGMCCREGLQKVNTK